MSHYYAHAWRTRRDHRGLGLTKSEEDKEVADALAHAQARKYTETATKRHNRNETNASMCIFICVCLNYDSYNRQAGRAKHRRLLTHSEKRDGDSIGNTRAFRGAESASRKPAQNGYGEDRGEELGSSPAALRPLLHAIYFPYLSLSFIAQGGRPLSYVISCFILCPFGQGYTSIFSQMNVCYLGFHLSRLVPTYVLYNKTCAHL